MTPPRRDTDAASVAVRFNCARDSSAPNNSSALDSCKKHSSTAVPARKQHPPTQRVGVHKAHGAACDAPLCPIANHHWASDCFPQDRFRRSAPTRARLAGAPTQSAKGKENERLGTGQQLSARLTPRPLAPAGIHGSPAVRRIPKRPRLSTGPLPGRSSLLDQLKRPAAWASIV